MKIQRTEATEDNTISLLKEQPPKTDKINTITYTKVNKILQKQKKKNFFIHF